MAWFTFIILVGAMLLAGVCSAEDSGWQERLSQVEGVTRVDAIPLDPTAQFFEEKYLVIFEQPLDWNDPDAGSFPQRVEIGLRKDAPLAVLETNGYTLRDQYPGAREGLTDLGMDDALEIGRLLGANYVNVEHRFFGGSRPADMSNTDTRYWQYHTAENAANDYHRIYQSLSPLLATCGSPPAAAGAGR